MPACCKIPFFFVSLPLKIIGEPFTIFAGSLHYSRVRHLGQEYFTSSHNHNIIVPCFLVFCFFSGCFFVCLFCLFILYAPNLPTPYGQKQEMVWCILYFSVSPSIQYHYIGSCVTGPLGALGGSISSPPVHGLQRHPNLCAMELSRGNTR